MSSANAIREDRKLMLLMTRGLTGTRTATRILLVPTTGIAVITTAAMRGLIEITRMRVLIMTSVIIGLVTARGAPLIKILSLSLILSGVASIPINVITLVQI